MSTRMETVLRPYLDFTTTDVYLLDALFKSLGSGPGLQTFKRHTTLSPSNFITGVLLTSTIPVQAV